jgi:choline-sulfatase
MIASPGLRAGRIDAPVSNLDILPTLCDLAGIELGGIAPWTDGQSLLPLAAGLDRTEPVLMEYAAEGSHAPMVAIRKGRFKFVHCEIDPPQLFDLESDPRATNLAAIATRARGGVHRPGPRTLGYGSVRRGRAREPGAPLGGLPGAA